MDRYFSLRSKASGAAADERASLVPWSPRERGGADEDWIVCLHADALLGPSFVENLTSPSTAGVVLPHVRTLGAGAGASFEELWESSRPGASSLTPLARRQWLLATRDPRDLWPWLELDGCAIRRALWRRLDGPRDRSEHSLFVAAQLHALGASFAFAPRARLLVPPTDEHSLELPGAPVPRAIIERVQVARALRHRPHALPGHQPIVDPADLRVRIEDPESRAELARIFATVPDEVTATVATSDLPAGGPHEPRPPNLEPFGPVREHVLTHMMDAPELERCLTAIGFTPSALSDDTAIDRAFIMDSLERESPIAYAGWIEMDADRVAYAMTAGPRARRSRYAFEYRLTLPPMRPGPGATVLVPLPARLPWQRVDDLSVSIDGTPNVELGLLQAPLPAALDQPFEIAYTASVTVIERRHAVDELTAIDARAQPWLLPALALTTELRDGAHKVLARLPNVPRAQALRALYDWTLENVHFSIEQRCGCAFCLARAFEGPIRGPCSALALVFMIVSRALGVPARLARGSLRGFDEGGGAYVADEAGFGFSHSWVECFGAPDGWFPVEFHSCVLREPFRTSRNTSAAQRAELDRWAAAYERYLFGSIDAMRVQTGRFSGGVLAADGARVAHDAPRAVITMTPQEMGDE